MNCCCCGSAAAPIAPSTGVGTKAASHESEAVELLLERVEETAAALRDGRLPEGTPPAEAATVLLTLSLTTTLLMPPPVRVPVKVPAESTSSNAAPAVDDDEDEDGGVLTLATVSCCCCDEETGISGSPSPLTGTITAAAGAAAADTMAAVAVDPTPPATPLETPLFPIALVAVFEGGGGGASGSHAVPVITSASGTCRNTPTRDCRAPTDGPREIARVPSFAGASIPSRSAFGESLILISLPEWLSRFTMKVPRGRPSSAERSAYRLREVMRVSTRMRRLKPDSPGALYLHTPAWISRSYTRAQLESLGVTVRMPRSDAE